MSQFAFWGAVELGLVFSFVALGVYLAFRVLDFPDLTVDGSFPLGAAVTAVLIISGVNPWLAAAVAMVAGAIAGLVTATLNVRFKILNLLASILTMIALFSINLRVMGRPNVALINQDTMLTPFFGLGIPDFYVRPLFVGALAIVALVLVWRFLESDVGLAMRATSENVMAAQTLGIPTRLVLGASWATASALGVIAGVFLAPALLLDPFFMLDPFLKGFAAAVLGGLNSLPGAVVGALILGVAESLTGAYLSIQFKNTLAFVVIIVVLLIRPGGLLGKEFKERV